MTDQRGLVTPAGTGGIGGRLAAMPATGRADLLSPEATPSAPARAQVTADVPAAHACPDDGRCAPEDARRSAAEQRLPQLDGRTGHVPSLHQLVGPEQCPVPPVQAC